MVSSSLLSFIHYTDRPHIMDRLQTHRAEGLPNILIKELNTIIVFSYQVNNLILQVKIIPLQVLHTPPLH